MDLLFKRYASPFVLLDSLIQRKSLNSYIEDLYKTVNEEQLWDYYLHKVFDRSWSEFLDECKPKDDVTEGIDLGATVNKSRDMLKNFTPERGE